MNYLLTQQELRKELKLTRSTYFRWLQKDGDDPLFRHSYRIPIYEAIAMREGIRPRSFLPLKQS